MLSFDGLEQKYKKNQKRVLSAIDEALKTGKRLRSPLIQAFEQAVYPETDTTTLAVSSGTAGLEISLRAVGVLPGDKVIVPSFSFAASAGSILAVGAKPLFVDVEEDYPFIDINLLNQIPISGVKALIAVHLYGTVQPQDNIIDFCRQSKIALIEDVAQAYGSYSLPDAISREDHHVAVLSFDPYKVLPGITGGGAVITRNYTIAENVRMIRNHGFSSQARDFCMPGSNSEISSVDASVLLLEIEGFEANNRIREDIAYRYSQTLRDYSAITVLTNPNIKPNNYHKFVVLSPDRLELANFLSQKNIPTKIHYERALPDYSLFSEFATTDYPNARQFAKQVLSLPIHPDMAPGQVSHVCNVLKEWKT